MGTHPIFESDFDCLTECLPVPLPAAWLFPLAVDTPQLHSPQIISQFWADLIQHGNWIKETGLMVNGSLWKRVTMFGFQPTRRQKLLLNFNLTAIGYVLFTLYDWREEAKHSEAHGH